MQGRVSVCSDIFANLVGAAALDGSSAEPAVHQVHSLFTSQSKEYCWQVGLISTPADLRLHLEHTGLEVWIELAGMALTDLVAPIRSNPAVQVRRAEASDLEIASLLLAPALHVTPCAARIVTEALLLASSPLRRSVFLAYLPGVEEPIGYGSTIYLPGQPIALLFCAAVLEAYRGQGVYTSLVKARIDEARQAGVQTVVIQAVRDSSAPICQKLGFVELGGLEWWGWSPETPEEE